ncbi:response regulator transcription factor [Azospirillum sp. SYSU D00513]|uniref:LuxR C-terminal-related transcriptional regulator n=1 Tax=Azospirillum sp. SYSU D00513 TaxID=2812561 RepID=UPI001A95E00A|nr:response regulator transcription factor [Azospirillum sp. SYSU D00513]
MNVLLADDHLLFRDGLRRLLHQLAQDLTFFEASSFDEVRSFCDSGTAFDLLLIDLGMPGWNGFSDLSDIRQRLPKALMVVVSASERRSDLMAALEAGAAGYIPKSSSAKVLLGALQLVLAGGVYLPAQAIRGDIDTAEDAGVADVMNGLPAGSADQLTPRQREVLTRLRDGKSNKQIAIELGLTEGTVKVHVTAILRLLGVRNRTQAALTAHGM